MTNDDTAKEVVAPEKTGGDFQIVYSDTDTLSSFLNRNSFGFFMKVFEALGAEIVISKTVLDELYSGRGNEIRRFTVERLRTLKRISIEDIDPFSDAGDTYFELSETMGKGEASALALAKHSARKAVVASNNLSDVADYAKKNNIELWPTAKILEEAINLKIMNMKQADTLWKRMKEDGLKLPSYETFEEYYRRKY